MAILIKEVMANMPDTLDTKKEIDEYFKNAMKDIVNAKKEQEAEAKKKKEQEAKAKKEKKAKKEVKTSEDEADEADEADVAKPKKQRKKKEVKSSEDEEDEEKQLKPSPRRFIVQPKKKKAKKEADEADEAKPKEVDEDGNEIKKPPTEYIIFKKEMGIKIKEMFPDLNYQKTVKKINDLWKIHKAEQQMN